jgi:aminoglycoside phosphotransferase (APT) family kinase protein
MRTLNIRALTESIFREESGLPSRLDELRFVSTNHTSVYRVKAGGSSYIVHATPHGTEDLNRIRHNLLRLQWLADERIPRVLAFREAGQDAPLDQRWAILVMSEIAGEELSSQSFNRLAWSSLCDLLRRIHAIAAHGELESAVSPRIDKAAAFTDFAETFALHLSGLPIRQERVRTHLQAVTEYVGKHGETFSVPPRLTHGDINRQNIRVNGGTVGLIDWSDLGVGDYAYDLATLKFALDSVVPTESTGLIRGLARDYRKRFDDDTLELRLRFFLALPGLVSAFWYTNESAQFPAARAWRVRTCYLHSEAQWQTPLCLDGTDFAAPVIRTEHWALRIPQPARGLFYFLAPKRVA